MSTSVRDRSAESSGGILTQGLARLTAEVNDQPAPPADPDYSGLHPEPHTDANGAATEKTQLATDLSKGESAAMPVTARPQHPRYSLGAADDTGITGQIPVQARLDGGGPAKGPAIWNPTIGKCGGL